MTNEELIRKIQNIDSVVDFFGFKPEILKALGYQEPNKEPKGKKEKKKEAI